MRLLLDSHVFLWTKAKPERLSSGTRALIGDPRNEVLVSVISAWELWIKHMKKPIAPILDGGPRAFSAAIMESGMALLDINLGHAAVAAALPLHHRDPFDRMLIAQAKVERLTLVTVDPEFARYEGLNLIGG
jgi:PIN domain nuclease of toxin-antitoxin system